LCQNSDIGKIKNKSFFREAYLETSQILEVQDLRVHFHTLEGTVKAVNGVSFALNKGETLGLVGESGCGKSVTALTILRLIPSPPARIASGQVMLQGENLVEALNERMRQIRGGQISMIFQEPMTSLNPVFTIGHQIAETFRIHQNLEGQDAKDATLDVLGKVQIPSPEKRIKEYPHQLSGGMRQRVMIAMALACNPEILIADEPTTALDVTIQAQILDLMLALRKELGTAILMITHDLGVIAETAQRVVVLYAGKVMESGDVRTIFKNPFHPYTIGLLNSVPRLGRRSRQGKHRLHEIPGIVPSMFELPRGCLFAPRCQWSMGVCSHKRPKLRTLEPGHQVRCWLERPPE
jgi:peptide/nickel transport system ATP-binding protein/oligopeptide transport system ATP-binding protein